MKHFSSGIEAKRPLRRKRLAMTTPESCNNLGSPTDEPDYLKCVRFLVRVRQQVFADVERGTQTRREMAEPDIVVLTDSSRRCSRKYLLTLNEVRRPLAKQTFP